MSSGETLPPMAEMPKKALPLSRIILLAILAVGVVALALDVMARLKAKSAHAAITEAAKGNNPDGAQEPVPENRLSPADIKKVVGREPKIESRQKGAFRQETYSWRGAMRSYFVCVIYTRNEDGKSYVMDDFAQNEFPRMWEEASPAD